MNPLILLIVLVAAMAFVSWYKRASPAQRQRALIYLGGGALALVLILRGRVLFGAIAAAIPLAYRAFGAYRMAQGLRGMFGAGARPTSGGGSEARTRYLHVRLDHGSGNIEGTVVAGAHSGRTLASMSRAELLELYRECRSADPQSVKILETYLDQTHGTDWRAEAGRAAGSSGAMDAARAREVLGVTAGASREEIIDAHRRLIQKLHPDRGGSAYLAAEINRAKAVLLGE